MSTCLGIKPNGMQCKNPPTKDPKLDERFCHHHQPAKPIQPIHSSKAIEPRETKKPLETIKPTESGLGGLVFPQVPTHYPKGYSKKSREVEDIEELDKSIIKFVGNFNDLIKTLKDKFKTDTDKIATYLCKFLYEKNDFGVLIIDSITLKITSLMDLLRDSTEAYYQTRRKQIFKTLSLLVTLTKDKSCLFGGGGGGRVVQELSQQIEADQVEISLLSLPAGVSNLSMKTKAQPVGQKKLVAVQRT